MKFELSSEIVRKIFKPFKALSGSSVTDTGNFIGIDISPSGKLVAAATDMENEIIVMYDISHSNFEEGSIAVHIDTIYNHITKIPEDEIIVIHGEDGGDVFIESKNSQLTVRGQGIYYIDILAKKDAILKSNQKIIFTEDTFGMVAGPVVNACYKNSLRPILENIHVSSTEDGLYIFGTNGIAASILEIHNHQKVKMSAIVNKESVRITNSFASLGSGNMLSLSVDENKSQFSFSDMEHGINYYVISRLVEGSVLDRGIITQMKDRDSSEVTFNRKDLTLSIQRLFSLVKSTNEVGIASLKLDIDMLCMVAENNERGEIVEKIGAIEGGDTTPSVNIAASLLEEVLKRIKDDYVKLTIPHTGKAATVSVYGEDFSLENYIMLVKQD